jgi:hypothetical protein
VLLLRLWNRKVFPFIRIQHARAHPHTRTHINCTHQSPGISRRTHTLVCSGTPAGNTSLHSDGTLPRRQPRLPAEQEATSSAGTGQGHHHVEGGSCKATSLFTSTLNLIPSPRCRWVVQSHFSLHINTQSNTITTLKVGGAKPLVSSHEHSIL